MKYRTTILRFALYLTLAAVLATPTWVSSKPSEETPPLLIYEHEGQTNQFLCRPKKTLHIYESGAVTAFYQGCRENGEQTLSAALGISRLEVDLTPFRSQSEKFFNKEYVLAKVSENQRVECGNGDKKYYVINRDGEKALIRLEPNCDAATEYFPKYGDSIASAFVLLIDIVRTKHLN